MTYLDMVAPGWLMADGGNKNIKEKEPQQSFFSRGRPLQSIYVSSWTTLDIHSFSVEQCSVRHTTLSSSA